MNNATAFYIVWSLESPEGDIYKGVQSRVWINESVKEIIAENFQRQSWFQDDRLIYWDCIYKLHDISFSIIVIIIVIG